MINILSIGKNLSTTQNLIIESVKNFCKTELKPRVINDYRNEVVDRNIFKKFGEMGIFGPTIKGYGCLGESYKTYGLIAKEIESIDSGYRSMFSVQSSLVMGPIEQYGNKNIKEMVWQTYRAQIHKKYFLITDKKRNDKYYFFA